ncbi:uncharacterized protein GGS22DRAFT_193840 [Annulohypoxylon maeteangense]|uniref:uncharacterized protein n=1 Tax=Annulohypoxylon maeteangense TaxID=1927788 RepID=UPI002007847C|nr:uncharacterized protein GGS22DRAFT_193840 [Annulohypoxylon maeteangense]KAI0879859.1 hypothetical protein GGS22DRAFT_193840 [Annulohypoxylon maeteangense]
MSYHGRCAELSGKLWESVVWAWRGNVIATAEVELGALQAAEQAPAHWTMLGPPKLRSGGSVVARSAYPTPGRDMVVSITTSLRIDHELSCDQVSTVGYYLPIGARTPNPSSGRSQGLRLPRLSDLAASVVEGSGRTQRQARRPQPSDGLAVITVQPSLKLDNVNLKQLPGSPSLSPRAANAFYECRNSSPAPGDSDCNNIINEVFALDQPITITSNACLTFQYGTCWGFFCSLCQTLSTDTNFIGNQLISAEALCVANGQIGTIVSQDVPQWQAGFVYQGAGLPDYDVC